MSLVRGFLTGIVVFATHYGEEHLDGGDHKMTLVEQTALTSRNITGVSGDNWRTLAAKVADQLHLEQTKIATAEAAGKEVTTWFVVRDASGRSLHQIKAGVEAAGDANAGAEAKLGSDVGSFEVRDASKWVTDVPLLSILVPHMPQGFIERFFAELGAESGKSDVRVISRGYAHVASKHRLRYAGFHPDPYGEGEKEEGGVCALRVVLPASRKNQWYRVTMLVRWYLDDHNQRIATEVCNAMCRPAVASDINDHTKWCRNALSTRCTHVSGCLFAFNGLPRSKRVGAASPTVELQMWHVPVSGTRHDPVADVALLPVTKPDRKRPADQRRITVGMVDTGGRRNYSALPEEARKQLGEETEEKEKARANLYFCIRCDDGQDMGQDSE